MLTTGPPTDVDLPSGNVNTVRFVNSFARTRPYQLSGPGSGRVAQGGLAWLVDGNMAVVVRGQGGLLVRVDPAEHDGLLAERGTATMVMRGRPLQGWITVAADACATPATTTPRVRRGLAYARTVPAK